MKDSLNFFPSKILETTNKYFHSYCVQTTYKAFGSLCVQKDNIIVFEKWKILTVILILWIKRYQLSGYVYYADHSELCCLHNAMVPATFCWISFHVY